VEQVQSVDITVDSTNTTQQAALRVAISSYAKHLVVDQDLACGNNAFLGNSYTADVIQLNGKITTTLSSSADCR
jgi:hypothetical protein